MENSVRKFQHSAAKFFILRPSASADHSLNFDLFYSLLLYLGKFFLVIILLIYILIVPTSQISIMKMFSNCKHTFLWCNEVKVTQYIYCDSKLLKVSKFQKQIFLFSFKPKNKQNYFLISTLASKNGSNKQMKALYYINLIWPILDL